MFEIRTDLALEAHEIASKNKKAHLDGVIYNEKLIHNLKLTKIEILNETGENETGKPIGKYLSLNVGALWDKGIRDLERATDIISQMFCELIPNCESVLVVGLGNTTLTADALGPKTISHVIVTRHIKEICPELFDSMGFFDLSAISPGVLAQTGIESQDIIKGIVNKLVSPVVVVIDALASGNIERLGTVVQISNVGIAPGSGIGNARSELSLKTLGAPVISVGIPTVVDAITLASNIINKEADIDEELLKEYQNFFVTPKDCDKIVSYMSKVIGYSINRAFHKSLSFEEILSLSD